MFTRPRARQAAAAAEGERIMRQMSDALSGAKALRFSTTESLDPLGSNPEGRVLRFSRTVTVRRPDAMYFELRGSGQGTPLSMAAYYDGRTLSLRNDVDRTWARVSVPATLDEMLDHVSREYSLPVPIADVVYSVPYEAFLGPGTKGGFAGRENLDGTACVRLAYTDAAVDVQVWIPAVGAAASATRRTDLQPSARRAEGAHRLHELGPCASDRRRGVRVRPAGRHDRDGVPGPHGRTPVWRTNRRLGPSGPGGIRRDGEVRWW